MTNEQNLTIEQIDKLMDKQIESNNKLLEQFEKHLYNQNLTKKTINKHRDNIDFYINTFILHYDIETPEESWDAMDMYFSSFVPDKTTWGSVNDTKSSIASLKKFYAYLVEIGRFSKDSHNEMLTMIKENKQRWFEVYDDEF